MKSMYRAIVESGDEADAPERVHVDHRGDRAVVTLDESDRLNVLSAPLVRQLRRALVALDADADVRTVVLTGADPGFSAGGDLKMMKVAVESLGEPGGRRCVAVDPPRVRRHRPPHRRVRHDLHRRAERRGRRRGLGLGPDLRPRHRQ